MEQKQLDVTQLSLDLTNFRTIPQTNETDAIKAMIYIKPERFYGILESLIEDGYLLTENIIVLKKDSQFIVKEGNRRIAALKIILSYNGSNLYNLPTKNIKSIESLDQNWKTNNSFVPCAIYEENETNQVDRIVNLTHGKSEKASRAPWPSVAKARYNRDVNKASEPALDILEKYIAYGKNATIHQKERWAGDYPITVLNEAILKICNRLGFKNISELALNYPSIANYQGFEDMILDIGLGQLETRHTRDNNHDFAVKYGVPPIHPQPNATVPNPTNNTNQNSNSTPSSSSSTPSNTTNTTTASPSGQPTSNPTGQSGTNPNPSLPTNQNQPSAALSITDPKHVINQLKKFTPHGNNRQKIVTLRDEIVKLKINTTPHAFCFVLRSMFEISAKVFAKEKNISILKNNSSNEKSLLELLRDITNVLTNNSQDKAKMKVLHGALTELAKSDGLLSITTMNNLVHNTSFSVAPRDICTLFGNVYPLLEELN